MKQPAERATAVVHQGYRPLAGSIIVWGVDPGLTPEALS